MNRKYSIIEIAALILVAVFFIWQFAKRRTAAPVIPVVTPVPSPVSKATPLPSPSIAAASPALTPAAPVTDTPAPAEKDEGPVVQFKIFENPICLPKSDSVILPDIYLREFYQKSESWVALPEAFTTCLKLNSTQSFAFYEFDTLHQYPMKPWVTMVARVKKMETFPSISLLEKTTDGKDYGIKNGAYARSHPDIFAEISAAFGSNVSKKWVKVILSKESIQLGPPNRPKIPQIHPVAVFKTIQQMPPNTELAQGAVIIDARPNSIREKFPLPFKSYEFHFFRQAFHHSIVNLVKLYPEKNKFIFKQSPDTKFIIISQDSYDMAPYNITNMIALAGFKSITIVTDGWERFGGSARTLSNTAAKISLDEFFILKKKGHPLIIDSRSPAEVSRYTIPGSTPIDTKDKDQASDETSSLNELDFSNIVNRIKTEHPQAIVVFGRNDLDQRPQEIINKLSPLVSGETKFEILSEGYENFYFYEKFREHADLARPVAHPPSQRTPLPPYHGENTPSDTRSGTPAH